MPYEMKTDHFEGLQPGAFDHKLREVTYIGYQGHETIVETWYKLDPEKAARVVEHDDYLTQKIAEARALPGGWIKLIANEAQNIQTHQIRRWWSVSLRPYIQGYGCDGTTNENVHAIAQRLATQHSLNYLRLIAEAYPRDIAPTDDASWLEADVVLAETFIPASIDPILVLHDLTQINNHNLVTVLTQRLMQLGILSEDWEKEYRATFDERVEQAKALYCAAFPAS